MGIFNRSKVPSADAVRLQGENHTTGYTFTAQINDLNAELREARAQIAAKDAELAELKGQWERLLEAYSAAKARSEQ
jgi:cell division protein FtsB